MKKKILFVCSWYPTEKEPHKGIFVREYAAALHQDGHKVVVFVIDFCKSKGIYKLKREAYNDKTGFEVHRLTIFSSFWKVYFFLNPLLNYLSFKYIKNNILSNFKPDLIHAHVINPSGVIARHISQKIKSSYIITEHWSDVGIFFRKTIFSQMAQDAYNKASFITVVSEFLKKDIAPYILNNDKIRVIPNIIKDSFNYSEFSGNTSLSFTSVGKWELPKNPALIIEALTEFAKESGKPIKYNIVGDGSLLEIILENKNNYFFELIYHGVLDKESIAEILYKTDFLLHCSEVETFSVVIAEAHCCGVPVLASNKGAMPELIDDSNGLVCENSVHAWLQALQKIIHIKFDRKRISENAKNRFDTNEIVERLNQLYNQL